jgi:hypothetical protein
MQNLLKFMGGFCAFRLLSSRLLRAHAEFLQAAALYFVYGVLGLQELRAPLVHGADARVEILAHLRVADAQMSIGHCEMGMMGLGVSIDVVH